jgi:hypothetical protein
MMRDIINRLQVITESVGLARRKPGDVFKDPAGNEIYFQEVTFYPEGGGKYTPDELDYALGQLADATKGFDVQWTNNRAKNTGGFGIAMFDTDDGGTLVYGRFFNDIKADPLNNQWDNQKGIPGYSYASKAATKTQAGMTPQDILTQQVDLTAANIVEQIAAKFGEDSPLTVVASRIASGMPLPIEVSASKDMSFTAFRDYFCELLHPIALQNGQTTGNSAEAEAAFLAGAKFSDCVISFGTSKTEGLSDSIMEAPNGARLKISSKGGLGAKASVKNVIDAVKELDKTTLGGKIRAKYRDVVELIDEIQKAGQAGAPLMLGVKYGIIDTKEAGFIKDLKNLAPVNLTTMTKKELNKVLGTSNLVAIAYHRDFTNPANVNLYYHVMASLASMAARQVNQKTNFSKAATDVLNYSGLIQVYTKAVDKNGVWVLQNFNAVFPGESIKGVELDSGKTHYSTGIKGNFTFVIDRGQGFPTSGDGEVGTAAEPEAKAIKQRVDIKPPGARATRSAKSAEPRARR